MKEAHLSLETLALLLAGDLDSDELIHRVIPHFLVWCPVCHERYEEILHLQKEVGHWDERVVVFEGRQAEELLETLKELPFDEQLGRVADDERFQIWPLCQLLLRESLAAVFEDPGRSVNFAELAVKVSQRLGESYDPHWVHDLQARAWTYLGNARRVLGELRSAETAFRDAELCLARSMTGNEQVRAETLDIKSSLRRDQGRFEEALALLDEAIALYQEGKDGENERAIVGALVKKARTLEAVGDLERAIEVLEHARELDSAKEPRLGLYIRHNLLLCLISAGRHGEAERLLPDVGRFSAMAGNRLDHLRLRWLEARLAAGLGRSAEAETVFGQVEGEFLHLGMGYDAALVALDLAILYAREHRTQELKRLATEIMPIFQSRDLHREALATLVMFQRACEEERLTVELAEQIASALLRGRHSRL